VGEQFDPNVGFYYNRARWMDPEIGRFLSADVYWLEIDHHIYQVYPKGYIDNNQFVFVQHRYLYADVNPINKIDPSGYLNLPEISAVQKIQGNLRQIQFKVSYKGAKKTLKCVVGHQVILTTFRHLRSERHHPIQMSMGGSRTGQRLYDLAGTTHKAWHSIFQVFLKANASQVGGLHGWSASIKWEDFLDDNPIARKMKKRALGAIMVAAAKVLDKHCKTRLAPRLKKELLKWYNN
jgi:RHS repeat-associated protein